MRLSEQDGEVTAEEDWGRLAALLGADEGAVRDVQDASVSGADVRGALLDGLDDAGALAYLQADDTGTELVDALVQLPRVFAAGVDLDEAADVDDLSEAASVARAVLHARGLRLVRLVEDQDAWPLAVLLDGSSGEAAALAERLGVGLRDPV